MTTVRVRAAQPDDAAAIAAVQVRSWKAAYRGLVPDAWFAQIHEPGRVGQWAQRIASPGVAVWLAEADAVDGVAVTGFCSLALPTRDADGDEDTAEITAFYVDPAAWRGGVGRALMDAALADLDRRGWTEATLWVFVENPRARGFYASCGFADDGGRGAEPDGPRQLRMRRSL